MYLFKDALPIREYLSNYMNRGKKIGFIPTMGALHEGHLSLLRQSLSDDDLTVCSIFVNPTQFNQKSDLENYPRTIEKDIEKLVKVGCDLLFYPGVQEIYPNNQTVFRNFDFGHLNHVLEALHRPGHFNGVAQVVFRLLEIIQPDSIYMGQKDYQQVLIIESMVEQSGFDVEVVMCPTVREADGLALSSRNLRLGKTTRPSVPVIYDTLLWIKQNYRKYEPQALSDKAMKRISSVGLDPEYFEIVDGKTLQSIHQYAHHRSIVACTAAWADGVRLIDNMILL